MALVNNYNTNDDSHLARLLADVGATAMDVGNAVTFRGLWGDRNKMANERSGWYKEMGVTEPGQETALARKAIEFGAPAAVGAGISKLPSIAPALTKIPNLRFGLGGLKGSTMTEMGNVGLPEIPASAPMSLAEKAGQASVAASGIANVAGGMTNTNPEIQPSNVTKVSQPSAAPAPSKQYPTAQEIINQRPADTSPTVVDMAKKAQEKPDMGAGANESKVVLPNGDVVVYGRDDSSARGIARKESEKKDALVNSLRKDLESPYVNVRQHAQTTLENLQKADEQHETNLEVQREKNRYLKDIKEEQIRQREKEEADKKEKAGYGIQNDIEKRWEDQYKVIDPTTGKPTMNNEEAVARSIFNGDRLPESKREMQNRILPRINKFYKKWFADKDVQKKLKELKIENDQEAINNYAQKAYLKFYHGQ